MKHFNMISLARVRELQKAAQENRVLQLLTQQEIRDLLRFAQDHLELLDSDFCKDDDVMEVTQLQVGDVLTEANVRGIGNLFAMQENETYTKAEDFDHARKQILFELGGQQLVDAFAKEDERRFDISVQKAMERFYKKIQERDAAIKKDAN